MDMPGDPVAPSNRHVFFCILAGTAALVVLGLQPLLYGAYVHEGTIYDYRLGLLSSAELFAIAAGSAVAVKLLRRLPVWPVVLVGIALLSLGNMLEAGHGNTLPLFAYRAIAGSGAGLLVGLAASAIARTDRIGFWAGSFLFGQALTQYGVVRWFSAYLPTADSMAVQLSLALAGATVLFMMPFLPSRLHLPMAVDTPRVLPPTGRGLVGLAAMFLCVGGTGGIWGYMELWLHSEGISQPLALHMLSIALLGQTIGAAVGAAIADGRWAWLRLFVLIIALASAVAFWMSSPATAALALAFGVIFTLAAPAFSTLLHQLDPEHRSVPYAATAQLAGISIVPTIAGETLAAQGLSLVLLACLGAIILSAVLVASQIPLLWAQAKMPLVSRSVK
jgi:MFS transporter, DHA1 family, inner membrane transport protein